MRIALIADIHANLPALEAVLSDIAAHQPDMILSLGDQVNLGPCPRETLSLLRQAGAKCLSGNHERYILSAMRGDPAYAGANFASLRFNAQLLKPEDITFDQTLDLEGITFCHSMPGDDRFPINDPTLALPRLRALHDWEPGVGKTAVTGPGTSSAATGTTPRTTSSPACVWMASAAPDAWTRAHPALRPTRCWSSGATRSCSSP